MSVRLRFKGLHLTQKHYIRVWMQLMDPETRQCYRYVGKNTQMTLAPCNGVDDFQCFTNLHTYPGWESKIAPGQCADDIRMNKKLGTYRCRPQAGKLDGLAPANTRAASLGRFWRVDRHAILPALLGMCGPCPPLRQPQRLRVKLAFSLD